MIFKVYLFDLNINRMKNTILKGSLVCFIVFCFISSLYSQEPMFKATFENNSTAADIGTEFAQGKNGGSFAAVSNPDPDDVNSSNYVLQVTVPQGSSVRAEYSNSPGERYPTEGETHIYTWKKYYPEDFDDGATIYWLLVGQWKTYPCEEYSSFGDVICGSGGIFNEIDLHDGETEEYRFRADPDCNTVASSVTKGEWVKYSMEIYWTNSSNGYYKLYKNNDLITEEDNVKTLMDGFESGTCDIYFTLGLYAYWTSSTKDELTYYIDDFYAYDKTSGMTLATICPGCVGADDTAAEETPTYSCDDFAVSEDITNSDYGASNGSISLDISGGTTPYTILWSDGNSSSDRTGLSAGTYTVEITDANGCYLNESYTVSQAVESQVAEGSGDPMFKATFESNSLTADIGTEFAQTANGGSLTVVENPNPDGVNSSCYVLRSAVPTGASVRAEYSNSYADRYPTEGETHIYSWKRYYPEDFKDDATIYWLLAGQWKTYPCEEYSDFGDAICGTGGIFNEIDLNDGETEEYRFRADPDCNTVASNITTGEWVKYAMEIYWTNESDGYYKLYKNGNLITEVYNVKTLMDGFESGTCDIYFTLGLYSYWTSSTKNVLETYIDDFYAYDKSSGATLATVCPECEEDTEAVSAGCDDFQIGVLVSNCTYGEDDGAINISISGGTSPYSISWSDGSEEEDRTGLSVGDYTVYVTDDNDCSLTKTYTVAENEDLCTDFVISEVITNPDSGDDNGSIDVEVSGGKEPYTISWSDGGTIADKSNLAAGVYTIEVTDDNGCYLSKTYTMTEEGTDIGTGTGTVDLCADFAVSEEITNSDSGADNGAINLTITGGTSPYTISWSDGSEVEDRTGLAAGNYTVNVTDNNDCSLSQTYTVVESTSELGTVNECSDFEISEVITYDDNDEGYINVEITGGTEPYSIVWSDDVTGIADRRGLTAGTYTLEVTDNNDCYLSKTYTISASGDPCVDFSVRGRAIDSDYDSDNGSITLSVKGGLEPYSYVWNDNVTNKNRSNLSAGSYIVDVTDANNCETTNSFEITENPLAFDLKEFYPNPTTGLVAVRYTSPSAEDVQVYVKDATGNLLISKVVSAKTGDNKQAIDLRVDDEGNELVQGSYEVVFYVNDNMKFNFRIVKKN